MVPIDPESSLSDPAHSGTHARPDPAGTKSASGTTWPAAGHRHCRRALAGLASLLAGERILSRYQSDLVPDARGSIRAPGDMQGERDARLYSAVLTFTAMGGFLGLAMGLAGGLASRSASPGWRRRFWGSCSARPPRLRSRMCWCRISSRATIPQSSDLVLPLLTHGAIWSAVGLIGGLAFGLGAGGKAAGKRPAGGPRRSGRGDDRLRNCRCRRLCLEQDGPAARGLDRRHAGWPSCWSPSSRRPARSWPTWSP